MFIVIENYNDKIDSCCRLVGTYANKATAQTVMHSLYMTEKGRHHKYEVDWDLFEDDEARLSWQGCDYDSYDWHIFEVKDCIY